MPAVKRLEECLSILDLRELARRRLPRPLFDYLDGAAETESSARRNTLAFDEMALLPRCLVDVSSIMTATRVLGQDVAWPVLCSPTGANQLYHFDGETAVARAAAATGTLYGVSVVGTSTLEDVAAAAAGPRMFQLLIFKDREITLDLMARAKVAGYPALCLTVDAVVRGKRERELRAALGLPLERAVRGVTAFAAQPRWLLGQMRRSRPQLANLAERAGGKGLAEHSRFVTGQLDPSVTWKEVRELVERWQGRFAVKGILSPDDARRAADVGASAVIVSNHGGRQLDGAVAAIEALPDIVRAVGGRMEVILDGGIRRGAHIVKALALGATACSVGRPYLFGLAAGGESGVRRVIDILRAEFLLALQLCGCANLAAIQPNLLRRTVV
jgi:L-lactate dehydrogenase (cytochrome)